MSCKSIENIVVPDGVELIYDFAFNNCFGLTEITLPASIKRIKDNAFFMCNALKVIKFNGTKAEWDAINKDKRWRDDTEVLNTIRCSDGDITFKPMQSSY